MKIILFRDKYKQSPRLIAKSLREDFGMEAASLPWPPRKRLRRAGLAIPWGVPELLPATAGNKAEQYAAMWRDAEGCCGWSEAAGDKWVLKPIHGHGGNGVVMFNPCHEVPPGYTKQPYVDKKIEVRVHVVYGQTVSLTRKRHPEGPEEEARHLCWNNTHGFHQVNDHGLRVETCRKLRELAIHACKVVGLEIGAVDIAIDKNNKQFVLEVNTAPALEPKRAVRYAWAIAKYAGMPDDDAKAKRIAAMEKLGGEE